MINKKKTRTVVAHNGGFHSDDIFAVASLSLAFQKEYRLKVIRTRDERIIRGADFVVDVGGVYSPARNRFDHHQKGGAGERKNSISYASFGLVWKKYSVKICGSKEIGDNIDRRIVQPVDAIDNGEEISKPVFKDIFPYTIDDFLVSFNPTWKEDGKDIDKIFLRVVDIATSILGREISRARQVLEAGKFVEKFYKKADDKRLIVFSKYFPFGKFLEKYKQPLFVVYPTDSNKNWAVRAVKSSKNSFKNRKDFPKSWAGKRDAELQKVTGVPDAIFCHNKRFLAVAGSKVGAIALAKLALN